MTTPESDEAPINLEDIPSLSSLTDEVLLRYVPDHEPYLTKWCKLDTLHRAALRVDALSEACRLADAKYAVWRHSMGYK